MSDEQADYWIVACSSSDDSRESVYKELQSRLLTSHLCFELSIFEIPSTLKFLTFDNLIRCVDDLSKHDTQIENVLKRIQRQALDIAPHSPFEIQWQRNSMSIDQYIKRFSWDDAKYPRTRSIRENIEIILSTVGKLDDEIRTRTALFHDVKTQATNIAKKTNANLFQRDLTDLLTPEIAKQKGFLETQHMTTCVVVVPRGLAKEWLQTYENLETYVVPRSAKNLDMNDKEGNSLWSVVVFRSALESFRTAAKSKKFIVREFTFCEDSFHGAVEHHSKVEAERARQENFLAKVCFAAFSDVFIAWVHLKAIRTFCECVLRFGVPPCFSAFWIKPVKESVKIKKIRKELIAMFNKGAFSTQMNSGSADPLLQEITGADSYYPYVSLFLSISS